MKKSRSRFFVFLFPPLVQFVLIFFIIVLKCQIVFYECVLIYL